MYCCCVNEELILYVVALKASWMIIFTILNRSNCIYNVFWSTAMVLICLYCSLFACRCKLAAAVYCHCQINNKSNQAKLVNWDKGKHEARGNFIFYSMFKCGCLIIFWWERHKLLRKICPSSKIFNPWNFSLFTQSSLTWSLENITDEKCCV